MPSDLLVTQHDVADIFEMVLPAGDHSDKTAAGREISNAFKRRYGKEAHKALVQFPRRAKANGEGTNSGKAAYPWYFGYTMMLIMTKYFPFKPGTDRGFIYRDGAMRLKQRELEHGHLQNR